MIRIMQQLVVYKGDIYPWKNLLWLIVYDLRRLS